MLHLPCKKAHAQGKHQRESLADAHVDMCNCSIQQGSSDWSKEDMVWVPGGVPCLSRERVCLTADLCLEWWGKLPGCRSASPAAMLSFLWLWTCKLLSPPANFNVSLCCMEMLVLLCETVRILFFFSFFRKCRQNNPVFHELILRNTRHISSDVLPPKSRLKQMVTWKI